MQCFNQFGILVHNLGYRGFFSDRHVQRPFRWSNPILFFYFDESRLKRILVNGTVGIQNFKSLH